LKHFVVPIAVAAAIAVENAGWLASPEGLLPGQRMNFRVPDLLERADLIAYLRTAR
jgi:cytochrome c2